MFLQKNLIAENKNKCFFFLKYAKYWLKNLLHLRLVPKDAHEIKSRKNYINVIKILKQIVTKAVKR